MNNVRKQKRANKSLPFFFKDEFKVSFIIIFISTILLITTFSFDIVPPILIEVFNQQLPKRIVGFNNQLNVNHLLFIN